MRFCREFSFWTLLAHCKVAWIDILAWTDTSLVQWPEVVLLIQFAYMHATAEGKNYCNLFFLCSKSSKFTITKLRGQLLFLSMKISDESKYILLCKKLLSVIQEDFTYKTMTKIVKLKTFDHLMQFCSMQEVFKKI